MNSSLWRCALIVIAGVAVFAGCSEQSAPVSQGGGMSPAEVDVLVVASTTVSDSKEYTGRLRAAKELSVIPRTSGYIVAKGFKDGERVRKGQLLFQIDDRTIRADIERLQAELNRTEAQIELAERDLKRADSLRSTNAISQERLDNRRTELKQAKATADSVRAQLKRTQVLDELSAVKAEFSGLVSDARVEVGSSVLAGQTILTTLVATDQIQAYFDVDENTYLTLKAQGFDYQNEIVEVAMALANESQFSHIGRIDFVDNELDPASGTIRMRAVYDNSKGDLSAGLFARVRLQVSDDYEAIVVPEKAIATDLSSKYVLVVDDNNIVNFRPITLGARRGESRVVVEGLSAGERIIVAGLHRAFPGAPVSPKQVDARGKAIMPESSQAPVSSSEQR